MKAKIFFFELFSQNFQNTLNRIESNDGELELYI